MQFGRLHGILLIVLGVLLLGAQGWIFVAPHEYTSSDPVAHSPIDGNPVVPARSGNVSIIQILPGIVGLLCVGGGYAIYVHDRNRPADVPVHPIR